MGTHPIFESDFDCLTEQQKNGKEVALLVDILVFLVKRFGSRQEGATERGKRGRRAPSQGRAQFNLTRSRRKERKGKIGPLPISVALYFGDKRKGATNSKKQERRCPH